jgi:hypothetical protein
MRASFALLKDARSHRQGEFQRPANAGLFRTPRAGLEPETLRLTAASRLVSTDSLALLCGFEGCLDALTFAQVGTNSGTNFAGRPVDSDHTVRSVLVYAVVSAVDPEEAVDVFIRLEDAERFVQEVRDDGPELAELLSVEAIELGVETRPGPLRRQAG